MKKVLIVIIGAIIFLLISFSITVANTENENYINAIEANSIIPIDINIIKLQSYIVFNVKDNNYFVNKEKFVKHLNSVILSDKDYTDIYDDIFVYNNRYHKYEIFKEKSTYYIFLYDLIDNYSGKALYLKVNIKNIKKLIKIISNN